MPRGGPPSHFLFVKKKGKDGGGFSTRIGAGWFNDWGGITIKLAPCVTLTDRDDIYITLYKRDDERDNSGWKPPEERKQLPKPYIPPDDDVPF